MSKPQLLAGLGLVVALAGGAVAFLSIRESQRRNDVVEALLRDAQVELTREELDRDGVERAIRALRADEEGDVEPRLLRARVRLELRLGRPQRAWDAHATLALEPDPRPEDLQLAAKILAQLHAQIGERELALQAMSFAERHYDATADVESLFLAWQSARRAGQQAEVERLTEKLQEAHPETRWARVVALLGSDKPDLAALRKLERDFDPVPEELELLLAAAAVQSTPEGESLPDEALERIDRVLESYPADSDARSVAVAIYHRLGKTEVRDLHLRWLLANASPDDTRRALWQQLLKQ